MNTLSDSASRTGKAANFEFNSFIDWGSISSCTPDTVNPPPQVTEFKLQGLVFFTSVTFNAKKEMDISYGQGPPSYGRYPGLDKSNLCRKSGLGLNIYVF